MASISLPPQSRPGFQHFDTAATSTQSTRRLTMPPLPNPPFVFPARDPGGLESSETSQERAPPALPAFSFNPGSDQSLQPPVPNPRPNGHRRRPSEYVGGDQLVTPGVGDVDKRADSSAPTQPSPPSGPGPGRGPGRRHHAHRRSAAVSGVDMNAISKALGTAPGVGSAPGTPGDRLAESGHEEISRPLSCSAGSLGRPTPPASPKFPPDSSIPPVPPIPAAIHIEPAPVNDDTEIGRPVSAVFHEPPVPNDAPSLEPSENLAPPTPGATPDRKSKPRPKTADASLAFELMQSHNIPDVPAIKRSKSTGHSRSRKSMSTGHLTATLANQASDDAHSTDTSRPSLSDDGSETASDVDHDQEGQTAQKPRSKSKKKKRVRSWAGSLLTRGKSKRHPKTEAKAENPEPQTNSLHAIPPKPNRPGLSRTNSEVGSVIEVDFDNDDVVVLRSPTNPEVSVSAVTPPEERPIPSPTLETSWKPRSFYEQNAQVETLSSPVIDLDAALGPFNTPDMRPTPGGPSNFSVATQRMYSGGRRGEFIGPEMRYHRRTESAPVMQPFDRSALNLNRFGGHAAVETPDVFDEEEEDEFLAANQSPRNGRVEKMPEPQVEGDTTPPADNEQKSVISNDSADTLTRAPQPSSPPRGAGLGIQDTDETAEVKNAEAPAPAEGASADSDQPGGNSSTGQPRSPAEILKSEESGPKALAPASPDVSPRFLAVDKRPATSPHELLSTLPAFSLSAGVSPSDSSFPSPDVPPRSFNDRQFSSHSYHHLPSEYPYASVEDVPSLTSSASTMTNRFSTSFFPRGRLSTDRAASFSAAVNRRTSQANASKRSSLASLSKLVGSAHPERSKLNQEEKPPGDVPDKTKKKHRRLSRLMQFWKPKDKDKTDTDTAPTSERPL
ncbi:hypothetical protein N7492_007046 [Penicillium capsulatum]|uniref:Cell wall proline rich protein n=1 Tax=Penicillium capsulatum TaxID=69766 RepID=A0A9W9HZ23_9EURO|nr:hypothetical protein N7492_007046 [Penicillium capsulatum]KAJ6116880.1 hypothetical protein N7512_006605 [Penicillium capsulatum]